MSQSPPADALRGLRILVVEDQFLLSEYARDILVEAGALDVWVAIDTRQALDLLEKTPSIDAAVIDINLGEQSGYQLAEKLLGGVIPFVSLDGRPIGSGAPGPRTIAMRAARESWIDDLSMAGAGARMAGAPTQPA